MQFLRSPHPLLRQFVVDGPIIESLLDVDFYTFTMQAYIRRYHPGTHVRFGLRNRTKIPLGRSIREGELREQLDHVRSLRATRSECHYLAGTFEYGRRMFDDAYIDWFANLQLPEYDLEYLPDGHIRLEFAGDWEAALHWETIGMPILTQLYFKSLLKNMMTIECDAVVAEGIRRLHEKIQMVQQRCASGRPFSFAEFGTRRRAFRDWQRYTDAMFGESLPGQYLGTSNTLNAMLLGQQPMGTNAHQLQMVAVALASSGSDEDMRAASRQVYERWWEMFGHGLSIALPDTYGTPAGLEDLGASGAGYWKGTRQDSGSPERDTDRKIAWYLSHDIDPREKLLLYSDGLTFPRAFAIDDYRAGAIKKSFALGTNATNDFPVPSALSIVVKPLRANVFGCVKLSDNPAKAQGDAELIQRYCRVFRYQEGERTECVY
ncbi:nicotinate phosphoribosyltransferase [Candidatus Uhrbacteria bacterium]|nr:nicotinate phosphoribosyltransferase [Candidatus Uhrbacteria bacterium]